MSGKLDKRMRALAENMLKKFGKRGTIARSTPNTYDEDTGKTITGVDIYMPIDFYIDADKTTKLRESGLILKNESIILISAKQEVILEQDKIVSDNIQATIISFNSIWSGAEIALYEAVCVL